VNLCTQLADENQALRVQQAQWLSERASLLEKNALARSRIEAMITRLKTMEENGL
jgi:cell division protein ZapB